MDVPFPIQYGDLTDADYAVLSHYHSQPYYNRDSSEIAHIKNYAWIRESEMNKIENERIALGETAFLFSDNHLHKILGLAQENIQEVRDSFLDILDAGLAVVYEI